MEVAGKVAEHEAYLLNNSNEDNAEER